MKYNGNIYRPPIEANTLLLPITEGCSHNSCAFCNMYQGIPFRMLSLAEVEDYLGVIRKEYGPFAGRIQRIYLVGADPFALSASRLLERIRLIKKYLPNVNPHPTKVGCFQRHDSVRVMLSLGQRTVFLR